MTWFSFVAKLMAFYLYLSACSFSFADDIKIKNESNSDVWACCAVQWTSYDGLSYNSNSEIRGGWTVRKGETKVISNVPKGGLIWISVNNDQPIIYPIMNQFTMNKNTSFEHIANYASGKRTQYWTTLPDEAKSLTSESLGSQNKKNFNGDAITLRGNMMKVSDGGTVVDYIRKGGQLVFFETPLKGGGTFIVP